MAGAVLAAGGWGHGGGPFVRPDRWQPPTVQAWSRAQAGGFGLDRTRLRVFERGTQRVWSLDEGLGRLGSRHLPGATHVVWGRKGRWWCVRAHGELRRLYAYQGNRMRQEFAVGRVLDCTVREGGQTLWVLEERGEEGVQLFCYAQDDPHGRLLRPMPGVTRLFGARHGVFALHPAGALWWVPGEEARQDVGWPLPAGVRMARSVGLRPGVGGSADSTSRTGPAVVPGELWLRLDRTGGPWWRVREPLGFGDPPLVLGWQTGSQQEGAAWPWETAPDSTLPTPVQRAAQESFGILRWGVRGSGMGISTQSEGERPRGWLLCAPEFLWKLDGRGRPLYGQGGFVLLQPP